MSTGMIWQTDSTSYADTERLGELIGRLVKAPLAIELIGDLGAGKTSLARGLARGCGSKSPVSSPSFSLSQVYECGDDKKLYHFDLYRLDDRPGVLEDELAEALAEPKAVVVVEWGQSVEKLLPKASLSIILSADPDIEDKRQVKIKYQPEHRGLMTRLETLWSEGRP